MIRTRADLVDWCREQREEAIAAVGHYEAGKLRFRRESTDVTPLQIANLKNIIAKMDEIISRKPDA